MSGKRVRNYKYCFVPWCTSTSFSCPDKIFFSVPENDKDRRKWLSLSRRDLKKSPLSPTSHLYYCEDHFDVTVLYKYRQWGLARASEGRESLGAVAENLETTSGTAKEMEYPTEATERMETSSATETQVWIKEEQEFEVESGFVQDEQILLEMDSLEDNADGCLNRLQVTDNNKSFTQNLLNADQSNKQFLVLSDVDRQVTSGRNVKRPFSCPHCEYKSASPGVMKRHVRSRHTGDRPFSCPHQSNEEKTLIFIDLYEKKEVLWDPKNPNYYNKVKKEDAWLEISEEMGISTEDCKKKIQSLMSALRRERQKIKRSLGTGKGAEEVYKSNWYCYNALAFLFDRNKPRETLETVPSSESDHPEEVEIKTKTKKRKETNDDIMSAALDVLKSSSERNEKSSQETLGECDSFGLYVANKLKNYSHTTRSKVEHLVSNILFRADGGEFESSYISSNKTNFQEVNKIGNKNCTVLQTQSASSHSPCNSMISENSFNEFDDSFPS